MGDVGKFTGRSGYYNKYGGHAMNSKERSRAWYLKNKTRHAAATKRNYEENRDRRLAQMKARRLADPEGYRIAQRAREHKYRAAHREKFLESHKRRYWRATGRPAPLRPRPVNCECCERPAGTRALCSDRDPATGIWRGWICFYCNTAIGKLGDSVEGVQRALLYLTRPSVKVSPP